MDFADDPAYNTDVTQDRRKEIIGTGTEVPVPVNPAYHQ